MPLFTFGPQRAFSELSDREVLALAVQAEEEDGRLYREFAESLKADYPASAKVFVEMAEEENEHRRRLLELFQQRFGDHIPLIRREDVQGLRQAQAVLADAVLRHRGDAQPRRDDGGRGDQFLSPRRGADGRRRRSASSSATSPTIEASHEALAAPARPSTCRSPSRDEEKRDRAPAVRAPGVQPGLAGLMDGSVSTLAPLFAAAFATRDSWETFLVGLAASIGAGISMGFAEALSDDGSLTGRGHPWTRGVVCGLMTALGGIGHTLPYLIGDFRYRHRARDRRRPGRARG